MANKKLGNDSVREIRDAMQGLRGSAAKSEAERLGKLHNIGWQRIYSLTADLRDGERKKRTDSGKRKFELVEGTDLWKAVQLVVSDKLDPDQALLTAATRGLTQLPSLSYFQQILREHGLGRKQRRNPKRAFRRFEAERPGQIFQIDCTGLKTRWKDEKSRRVLHIEGVDKNHPEKAAEKQRVFQILLVDDYSRRKFLRYVAAPAITSFDMVRFECEAFTLLGIPEMEYTDQGSEFKARHKRAENILNALPTIRDTGGFRHVAHAPHQPQATGKVESGHKWAEKADRYVGLALTEGQEVSIEDLNRFADRMCTDYNNRTHRTTGETPMTRWFSKRVVIRTLPKEIIESALLSEEFEAVLDGSMTVAHKGRVYKIPGNADVDSNIRNPFVNFIGQKVKVVVPPNIDLILLTLPDGSEWELEKMLATADRAGDFRRAAMTVAEDLTKRLKESRKEEVKAIRAKTKLVGIIEPVPHFNVEIAQPETNVTHFPHTETVVSSEEINEIVPVIVPESVIEAERESAAAYGGKPVGYWQAVAEYSPRFENGIDEAKEFLLNLFPGTEGELPAAEVLQRIESRYEPRYGQLRAVS